MKGIFVYVPEFMFTLLLNVKCQYFNVQKFEICGQSILKVIQGLLYCMHSAEISGVLAQ